MFGDVGGLNDFLVLLLAAIFSSFADKMLLRELASKLFHTSVPMPRNITAINLPNLAKFKPLKTKRLCLNKKRKHLLILAQSKLDDSLNVVRLIRSGRIQRTLLRLLLNKEQRSMIGFQRREAVIEIKT